jgi:hypothetical protein
MTVAIGSSSLYATEQQFLSTVLFFWTLSPTNPQATPFGLRKSFWGSVTTRAVSFGLISMAYLLKVLTD